MIRKGSGGRPAEPGPRAHSIRPEHCPIRPSPPRARRPRCQAGDEVGPPGGDQGRLRHEQQNPGAGEGDTVHNPQRRQGRAVQPGREVEGAVEAGEDDRGDQERHAVVEAVVPATDERCGHAGGHYGTPRAQSAVGRGGPVQVRRGIGRRQTKPLAPPADRRRIKRSLPRIPHPKSRWHGPSRAYHASAKLLPDARSLESASASVRPTLRRTRRSSWSGLEASWGSPAYRVQNSSAHPRYLQSPFDRPLAEYSPTDRPSCWSSTHVVVLFVHPPISAIYPADVPLHGIGCHGLVREFQAQRVLRQLAEFSDVPHAPGIPDGKPKFCIFQRDEFARNMVFDGALASPVTDNVSSINPSGSGD